ncbi:MAG: 16S rRNA (uracil(1498)-N(3))-methyltransferase [Erysipelotrichaceae bacterium]|nr:16S rRNA (uracil(1498)-N(3))-methyltransferase [Erysipelotrichaceae bacterium]
MRQFFLDREIKLNDLCELDENQAHHVKSVLRMAEDDPVRIVDSASRAFLGCLKFVDRKVFVYIDSEADSNESPRRIVYCAAMIKKDKWETVLQKAAELGASTVVPVITRRTIIHLEDRDIKKKLERWNKITLEACQQSNRNDLCEVVEPVKLKNIDSYKQDVNLVAYENEDETKLRDQVGNGDICFVIGPEGGFEESEIEMLKEKGFTCVSLGNRILRAETAGLYMLSVIDAWGD